MNSQAKIGRKNINNKIEEREREKIHLKISILFKQKHGNYGIKLEANAKNEIAMSIDVVQCVHSSLMCRISTTNNL